MEQNSSDLSFENEFTREKIGLPQKRLPLLIGLFALVAVAIVAVALLLPSGKRMPVITEVMTSNHEAYVHPDYGTVDWVEIYNPTDADIDLSGFGFTNEIKRTFRYTFPEGTVLKPGEYLLLYCTGGTEASDADPFCTGFNLSADGEDLYLVNRSNVEADEVHVPAMEPDTCFARTVQDKFVVTDAPTPGSPNGL